MSLLDFLYYRTSKIFRKIIFAINGKKNEEIFTQGIMDH